MRMNQVPRGMENDRIDGIVCIEMFDKEYSTFLCETKNQFCLLILQLKLMKVLRTWI